MCTNCVAFYMAELILNGRCKPYQAEEFSEIIYGEYQAEIIMDRLSDEIIKANARGPVRTLGRVRLCACEERNEI